MKTIITAILILSSFTSVSQCDSFTIFEQGKRSIRASLTDSSIVFVAKHKTNNNFKKEIILSSKMVLIFRYDNRTDTIRFNSPSQYLGGTAWYRENMNESIGFFDVAGLLDITILNPYGMVGDELNYKLSKLKRRRLDEYLNCK